MKRAKPRPTVIGIGGLTILLGLFLIGAWPVRALDAAQPQPAVTTADLVDRVRPAVVTVVNQQRAGGFGADQAREAGRGTGFIVVEEAHVVTNWHVVDGGDEFEVIFADGREQPAELVGADQVSDLAVVRIGGDLPATVPLGDSGALRVGEPVVAIGSPLGEFTNTVTQGIVSALGRNFPGEPFYTNLVQHDAAINPGNSGGPLFNAAGEVVGVNTLGINQIPGRGPVQGLFFAIPSNTVEKIAAQLIAVGRVAYPFFGIGAPQPVTDELAAQYDLPADHGVLVTDVTAGGPAAAAGLRPGDIVLAIDGQRIDRDNSFTEVLFAHEPGEAVEATVQRGDGRLRLDVTLEERPRE